MHAPRPSSRAAAHPDSALLTYLGLAHFVNDMLTGAVAGLLPLLEAAFHLNYAALGSLITLQNVTSSVVQPVFGAASDRRAMTWLLPLGPALAAAGLFALGRMPTAGLLYAAVAVLGLGSASFHPEGSRAAHTAAGERKGYAQAMFQVGGNLGFACGPLLVPLLLARTGLHGTAWMLLPGGAMAVLGIALQRRLRQSRAAAEAEMAALRARASGDASQAATSARGPLVALLVIIALRSFVQLGLASFLPLEFVHVRHESASLGATMSFLFLAAGGVGTFVGGLMSDRMSSIAIVRLSLAASVPLMAVLPDLGGAWFVADLLVLGFVVLSTFAVTVTLGQAYMPGAVGVSSGLTIGLSVGAGGLGTVLLGTVADAIGITAMLRLLFLLPALAFALSLLLARPAESGRAVPA
ncbi:MAG: MFS transporter [Firmicutes bacterium]|nr:MFS transporter [Bacillota bacterium]